MSMGATSARHLRLAIELAEQVLAIEATCAAQGLDFRAPLKPGAGVARAHEIVRSRVSHLDDDRPLSADIAEITALVHAGDLLATAATGAAHG